jgi:lysophospholipase L1-like esterase
VSVLAVVAAGAAAASPAAYTTLDPAKKAANVILSNGDLRAETNSTTGGGSVLTVLGKNSGKFYFEVQPDQLYSVNPGFLTGISIGTGTEASYPGATTASRGFASTSSGSDTWLNATPSNNAGTGAASLSAYHRWAVDVDAGRAWVTASNRTGSWIGGGDPAAGTSPTFTFTAGSTVFPMLCPRRGDTTNAANRNRLVFKVAPSSWAGSAPSGFGAIEVAAPASPVLGVFNSSTPTVDTAIPSGTLSLISGFIDLEWTGEAEWALQEDSTLFYAWSLNGGAHSLRYTGGESGNWILRVNGSDVLTAPTIVTSAAAGQRAQAGQFMRVRAWWNAGTGALGLQMSVNGVYAYQASGTASGTPITTPTTGWLNSLSGGSPNPDIKQVSLVVYGASASRELSFNGAAIGDSTVASYIGDSGVPVASLLRSAAGSRNSAISSLAIGGATTANQETNWTAFSGKSDLRWVVIQVGLNDIDPAEAAAPAIARIQSLVNAVNAQKPSGCRVYIATMIPAYARMVTRYGAGTPANTAYAKWQAMNTAISGGGGTPITGVDGRITSHTATMDDGVGNLAAAYDSGDGIHPNNAGRQVIADAWLVEIGEAL